MTVSVQKKAETPHVIRVTPAYRTGELLVQEGYLTQEQLENVLKLKKRRPDCPIGEICVQQKLISRADLQRILRKYQKNIPIGELLINMGLIDKSMLAEALKDAQKSGEKVGRTLIAKGYIEEPALVDALSIQLGIPKIVPALEMIDRSLLNMFNPEFLLEHEFIPAFKEDGVTTLIMADPLNSEDLALASKLLDSKVQPAIAVAGQIKRTIQVHFQKLEVRSDFDPREISKDLVIGEKELFKAQGGNIMEVVNFIISSAILERATDIHIEPQDSLVRVRYRIDGILHHKTDLPKSLSDKLASRIKAICGLDIAEKRRHQDGRIEARIVNKEYDLRVSTYSAIWGENIVIRIQNRNSAFIDVNMLGFSRANLAKYLTMLDHPSGIILVTGPTGSGKSTTLYASMQHLNKMDRAIITVEDPVEYTIEGVIQATIPRKVEIGYKDYLKSMMRQDPDVLMIGEIRDVEAAEAVIQASLTGHKVLTTFHTDDATGALLRLMDMGIETFLISSTVVSVVSQRLVRKLCSHCKTAVRPHGSTLSFFDSLDCAPISRYKFFKPEGCVHCGHSGYKGMTGIHEVLVVNDAIRDEILRRSTSSEIKRIARKKAALVSMSEDGFYKALKGITSLEEVMRVVYRNESSGLSKISIEELVRRSEQ